MMSKREVYQGMNKAQMFQAVADAPTVTALEEMWSAWSERGYSTTGVLYMEILKRKAEMGVDLSKDEQEQITKTSKAAAAGAALPPIAGAFNPAGGA